jgi:predicted GNAT family acetyltransferase
MRVQSCRSLSRFLIKTESFLLENEVVNNLICEVLLEVEKKSKSIQWAGNILENGKILLCAVLTSSNYLLISSASISSTHHLIRFIKRKKWKIKGVSGPSNVSLYFSNKWIGYQKVQVKSRRNFSIYETKHKLKYIDNDKLFSIKKVGDNEWPRARLWAMKFALESTPKLNRTAIVNMAKSMMKEGNLFFLQKSGLGSCGMVGFGRNTQNYKVINLVYIPIDDRGKMYAQNMMVRIVELAHSKYHKKCLLFSDYTGEENLYENVGFHFKVEYCERIFF